MKNVSNAVNKEIRHFLILGLLLLLGACKNNNSTSVIDKTYEGNGDNLPRVTQEMVPPPLLPKFDQVDKDGPKIIQVTFTVEEKKIEVAPGDSIWAFTYNGTVPGPMIVAHQGDFVELTYTHLRAHETDSYLVCRLLL